MRKTLSLALFLALLAAPLWAGVVYQVDVVDHGRSSGETETMETRAQGGNLAMNVPGGRGGRDGKVIYRGDRREMIVINDEDRTYMVIDSEMAEQIAGQLNSAMSQLQEALENVPEGQREAMEKMLKERMPQQAAPQVDPFEIVKTGKTDTVNGYGCTYYRVEQAGRTQNEMCVTPWSRIEGGDEAASTFKDMAAFASELMSAFSSMSGLGNLMPQGGIQGIFTQFEKLDGFPVVVREFDELGELESEATLRSAERRTLDPADFEPPAGYKRQEMPTGQ